MSRFQLSKPPPSPPLPHPSSACCAEPSRGKSKAPNTTRPSCVPDASQSSPSGMAGSFPASTTFAIAASSSSPAKTSTASGSRESSGGMATAPRAAPRRAGGARAGPDAAGPCRRPPRGVHARWTPRPCPGRAARRPLSRRRYGLSHPASSHRGHPELDDEQLGSGADSETVQRRGRRHGRSDRGVGDGRRCGGRGPVQHSSAPSRISKGALAECWGTRSRALAVHDPFQFEAVRFTFVFYDLRFHVIEIHADWTHLSRQ